MTTPATRTGPLGRLLRLPVTPLFLLVMLWANAQAGTLHGPLPPEVLREWGISQAAVWDGEVWRLFTATFLSHDPGMLLRQMIFAAVVIGYTEWRVGSLRALLLFFGLDAASSVLLLLSISGVPHLSDASAQFDVGMSMGGFGLIGYTVLQMNRPWVWLLAVILSITLKIWLNFEPLVDTGHVLALCLGALVGAGFRYGGRNTT